MLCMLIVHIKVNPLLSLAEDLYRLLEAMVGYRLFRGLSMCLNANIQVHWAYSSKELVPPCQSAPFLPAV